MDRQNLVSVKEVPTSQKSVTFGTHRIRPPKETFARVLPYLPAMGITRIADVTHLDEIGIPVFQAIRPNSRNLSVSQGKGVTPILAKVSALMEAVEMWHAEQPALPVTRAAVGDMQNALTYVLGDLNVHRPNLLHDNLDLEWYPARQLLSERFTYVPVEYVRLDFTMRNCWLPPLFRTTSNGLASGNTRAEAILHGLYESIERDALARKATREISSFSVDEKTVDGQASAYVLEQLLRSDITVHIEYLPSPVGIACFSASIISPAYPIWFWGSGCHLDADVALSRALTEAIQSRLTAISGTRDDIRFKQYQMLEVGHVQPRSTHASPRPDQASIAYSALPSYSSSDLEEDLQFVGKRIYEVSSQEPVVVNLTHPEFGIPVSRVVVPQFLFAEAH